MDLCTGRIEQGTMTQVIIGGVLPSLLVFLTKKSKNNFLIHFRGTDL